MKHFIIFIVLISAVFAQGIKKEPHSKIPSMVKSSFSTEYPDVKKAKWDSEDGEFEASFIVKGLAASATYDSSGHKKAFEIAIKKGELPAGVLEYVKKNYPKHKLEDTATITDDKGNVTYEVGVIKAGKVIDLIFDKSGKFVKTI